jgi:hypothetical protein
MAMQNSDDRYVSAEDDEIHEKRKAMYDPHPNVIEHDWKPQRLLLDRSECCAHFINELLTEPSLPRLIPRERFRDIRLCRLPNEQARHLCAARLELLNRLTPGLARIAILLQCGPPISQQLRIGGRWPDQIGVEAIP